MRLPANVYYKGELVEFLHYNDLEGTFGIYLEYRSKYGHNVVYSVEKQEIQNAVYDSEIRKIQ